MQQPEFIGFRKIARLSREIVISEKIDGTNGQIHITDDGDVFAAGRNRYLTENDHNFHFWNFVQENKNDLLKLGPGRHFGEWWGYGINRGYGLKEKRFSLFNVHKWGDETVRPSCCYVVPVIQRHDVFDSITVERALENLKCNGSIAVPGFMKPEGIVIFHDASGQLFKKTLEKDELPKGMR